MKAHIIEGKKIAEEIQRELKKNIANLPKKPGLAILLIGEDVASELYVRLKKKAAEFCDIDIHIYKFDTESKESEVLETIQFLNNDSDVHGIIVQLPLPVQLNPDTIIKAISPEKDVDGFHPFNTFLLEKNKPSIIPGLALSIMRLIKETKEPLQEKNTVIISNSQTFADPIIFLMKKEKINAQYISAKEKNLGDITKQADIIVVAVGKVNFIEKDFVKDGAIIIDVGINRLSDGKITGDVSTEVLEKDVWITPVPGGVGPMTVAMLLYNTYLLAQKDPKNI